jgi:hypothetical protein
LHLVLSINDKKSMQPNTGKKFLFITDCPAHSRSGISLMKQVSIN